jgi:hypothetical protein
MANTDFAARSQIVESLVTGVTLFPGKAIVSGVIAVDGAVLRPLCRAPAGHRPMRLYAAGVRSLIATTPASAR